MEKGNLKIVLQNLKGGFGEEEAIYLEIEDDIDIVMLTETHLHDVEDPPLIPGFDVSFKASRPRNAAAAGYGGVAVYFKQELFGKISIWKKKRKRWSNLDLRQEDGASGGTVFLLLLCSSG